MVRKSILAKDDKLATCQGGSLGYLISKFFSFFSYSELDWIRSTFFSILKGIDPSFIQYHQKFKDEKITANQLLSKKLTKQDYLDIGITDPEDLAKILAHFQPTKIKLNNTIDTNFTRPHSVPVGVVKNQVPLPNIAKQETQKSDRSTSIVYQNNSQFEVESGRKDSVPAGMPVQKNNVQEEAKQQSDLDLTHENPQPLDRSTPRVEGGSPKAEAPVTEENSDDLNADQVVRVLGEVG